MRKVKFTHPRSSSSFHADIDLRLTAIEALKELHSSVTGPFLQKLKRGQKEKLVLRRLDKDIPPNMSLGEAGAIEGDYLDVVIYTDSDISQISTENSDEAIQNVSSNAYFNDIPKMKKDNYQAPSSEVEVSWVGYFEVKRKPSENDDLSNQYIEDVKRCIKKYFKDSYHYKILHNITQLIVFTGAALVTIMIAIPEASRWIPAVISGIVSIAAAIANFYKFSERTIDLYLTAQDLQQELNKYILERKHYKNLDDKEATDLFIDRIETIMRDHTQRSLAIEKSNDNSNKDSIKKD